MALQKQQPEFIPILGLDTNADPRNAPPGTLDMAQDSVFKRSGAGGWELRKRFGYTSRTTAIIQGGNVGSGRKLCSFNNEQLILSTSALYSWDATATKWGQVATVPAVPQCTLTADPVSATRLSVLDTYGCAYGGGYVCTVYGQGANQPARVSVVSLTTGVRVLDTPLAWSVTTGIREIRVVALASVFMIVASFATGNLLACKTIAFATPTTVSAEATVSAVLLNSGQGPLWDIQRSGSNDWCVVGMMNVTPNVQFVRLNSNQTTVAAVTTATTFDQGCSWLTWDASDGKMYLMSVSSAAGLRTFTVDASTTAVSATTVNDAAVTSVGCIAGYRTGTTNNLFTSTIGGLAVNNLINRSTGGAVSVYQRGLTVNGKPFLKNGRYFLPCVFDNINTPAPTGGNIVDQRAYFILDVTSTTAFTGVVVAKVFYGQGAGQNGRSSSIATTIAATSFADIDSNRTAIVFPRLASDYYLAGFPGTLDNNIRDAWLVTIDFSMPSSSPAATAGENLFLPGGSVKEYDGSIVSEAGFHVIPEFPAATTGAGYGSGTVGVCIVWKYTDNRGQVHHSSPSQAQFVAAVGGISSVACQTYRLSERATQVAIEVYFTDANGSVFYLAGQVANDPTVDTVTFTVTGAVTTANVTQRAQLYTSDGSLAHEPLPPARLMAAWRGRIFLAGTEDSTDLWVSDEWFSGEGVYFSSANVVSIEKEGGPITALAEMDDRLIIFKRESLYELQGSGPSSSGDGNFEQPARITATVGTVIPESVVKTPQGLMFQSLRGFYLLPIGGGLPIRLRGTETLESVVTTGAALLEDKEQVRWVSATGTTLYYHFGLQDQAGTGRWTISNTQFAVDCAIFAGKFCYMTSTGFVEDENGAWDDNGVGYGQVVQWTHLSPGGAGGRAKLYDILIHAQILSATTLTALLAYNYDDAGAVMPLETTVMALTTASAVPLRLSPTQRRCTAVHVRLTETASTTQGVRLTGLALNVGIEAGGHKAGAAF